MSTVKLPPTTAIITAFEQPRYIMRLLKSLHRFQPGLRTLVASDRAKPKNIEGIEWIRQKSDAGLAACRNALLARVRTPYFLLLEDGMQFHRRTQIEHLVEPVFQAEFDLVAGDVVQCQRRFLFTHRKPDPQHGHFVVSRGNETSLELRRGDQQEASSVSCCDLVHDFFVGRTDRVRAMGGWDPELENQSSTEFFFRAHSHGLQVGVCRHVTIWRWNQIASARPNPRSAALKRLAVDRMGFAHMLDFDGKQTSADLVKPAQAA